MKHIKNFDKQLSFNNWINSNKYITPYISKINDNIIYQKYSRVPYGMQEIEYLRSPDSSYIDLGIQLNSDHKIYFKFRDYNNISSDWTAVGLSNGGSNGEYIGITTLENSNNPNKIRFLFLSGTLWDNYSAATITLQNDRIYEGSIQKYTGYVNNTNLTTSFGRDTLDFSSNNIRIGMRVDTYYFIIESISSGETIFNGIPVRIENTGYIYDTISKQLYGTNNTSFILGPDI